MRGVRVVLRNRHEALILLRKDELRRNRVYRYAARFGDRGRTRYGLCGGWHSARSCGDYGASGEHGEFSCDTAEKRFPVKWHACIPFPL